MHFAFAGDSVQHQRCPRVRHTYVYVNVTPCNHLMPEFQAGAMTEHTTQRQDYGWGLSTQQIPWTQCETRKYRPDGRNVDFRPEQVRMSERPSHQDLERD